MALTPGQQADVDLLRQLCTEHEALESKVRAAAIFWTRADNNSAIPEDEPIAPGIVGGDMKKAMAAIDKRLTEVLNVGDENTVVLISKVSLP
jgi:hypothetical protein